MGGAGVTAVRDWRATAAHAPAQHAPTANTSTANEGSINNFPAFSRCLRCIWYPKDFKPAIDKYEGRSDPSIWLKKYSIAARASGGQEDHMAGYFPLVMGEAPLLWLNDLPPECIHNWDQLARLFTSNYQATYD